MKLGEFLKDNGFSKRRKGGGKTGQRKKVINTDNKK